MCTYNISIDDALMEKVKMAIGNDIDESSWIQQQVEMLLVEIVASKQNKVFDEDYMTNLINLSAPTWKELKDADAWVRELRG